MRHARTLMIAALAAASSLPLASTALAAKCNECGVITSLNYVEEKGRGSGLGA